MRNDVAQDLSESAQAFVSLVWPVIQPWLKGGELRPVEAVTATDMARDLDILAGIDAWHIVRDGNKMRGIASRVQPMPGFRTFTIRYRRTSGAATEWEKRIAALDNPDSGWLMPHLWCHAYRTNTPVADSKLTGVALVRTADLFTYVRERLDEALRLYQESIESVSPRAELQRKCKPVYIEQNSRDGNLFIVANWDRMRKDKVQPLRIEPVMPPE